MRRNKMVIDDFTFDMSDSVLFKKDQENYIDQVGMDQLNTIGNLSLLDIFLEKGNSIELHYHPNASEVVYCVSGEMTAGLINQHDNEWRHFRLQPGEVISIPQGYWHYVGAGEDDTHLLATFDTNQLQTVFGSDVLRKTPKDLMAEIYCLNEEALKAVLEPVDETVIIGPPADCDQEKDAAHDEVKMKRPSMMMDESYTKKPIGLEHNAMSNAPKMTEHTQMKEKRKEGHHVNDIVRGMMEHRKPKKERMTNQNSEESQVKKPYYAKNQTPKQFGGTVVRELNLCDSCMREYSR